MKTKKTLVASSILMSIVSANIAVAHEKNNNSNNAVYRIEMHNETTGQWFSPYLCALHSRRLKMFQVDRAASTGQSTYAEDGFNGILAKELRENDNVYTVLETGPGLTPPGTSRVEYIKGPANARLTCMAMPVTTNDVLTVIQNVKTSKQPSACKGSLHWSGTPAPFWEGKRR